jgi:hypothetical protein
LSQQSLQKTQQVLNLVGQQLPAIFQAASTRKLDAQDIHEFVCGTIFRGGVSVDPKVSAYVSGLCGMMIDEPQPAPQIVDDPIAET